MEPLPLSTDAMWGPPPSSSGSYLTVLFVECVVEDIDETLC